MASAVGGIISSPLQAAGAIMQGDSDANIATYNENVAQQSAGLTEAQGAEQARRSLVNSTKMIGGMRAAYGASGVSAGGSVADVLRSSAAQGELNSLTIKNTADIKATALTNEASLDSYRANMDRSAGYVNAATSLLSLGTKNSSMGSSGTGGSGGEDDGGYDGDI